MRRYVLLIPLLFLALPWGRAQSVGMSDSKTKARPMPIQEVYSFDDSISVVVLLEDPLHPREITLMSLNGQGGVTVRKKVPLGDEQLPLRFEQAFRWGDRLTVLTSLYYPGPQRNLLLLRQYAVPSLEEVASRVVDEVYMPRTTQIPFGYSLSPDGSQLLCYGWSYLEREDSARLSLTLFDRELHPRWDKEYKLPYRNATFFLYGALLNQQGGVYVLAEDYLGSAGSQTINPAKLKPVVLYVDSTRQTVVEYPLRPDDRQTVSGIRMTLTEDGGAAGAGFYQRGSRTRHEGISTFFVDGPSGHFESHLLPIEESAFRRAGSASSNYLNFEGFTVDRLWEDKGALFLAAEAVIPDPFGNYDLLFGDILLVRLRDRQTLDWMARLPREQKGAWNISPLLSFSAFRHDQHYYFLYGGENARNTDNTTIMLAECSAAEVVRRIDMTPSIRERSAALPFPGLAWALDHDRLILFGLLSRGNRAENGAISELMARLIRSGTGYTPDQFQSSLILLNWPAPDR